MGPRRRAPRACSSQGAFVMDREEHRARAVQRRRGRRLVASVLAWCLSTWGAPPAAGRGAGTSSGILLNVGVIATGSAEAEALRAPVGSFEGRRLHLVQFAGPIRPDWYADLEATGVEVVQYVPSFAYLVYGDVSALARVQQMAQSSLAVR